MRVSVISLWFWAGRPSPTHSWIPFQSLLRPVPQAFISGERGLSPPSPAHTSSVASPVPCLPSLFPAPFLFCLPTPSPHGQPPLPSVLQTSCSGSFLSLNRPQILLPPAFIQADPSVWWVSSWLCRLPASSATLWTVGISRRAGSLRPQSARTSSPACLCGIYAFAADDPSQWWAPGVGVGGTQRLPPGPRAQGCAHSRHSHVLAELSVSLAKNPCSLCLNHLRFGKKYT